MASRHSGPIRYSGDVHASSELRDAAKKLIGELVDQRQLGGPATAVRHHVLPNGAGVVARLINGQPQAQFYPPGALPSGDIEEVIYLYISSAGGLRIFDLGEKRLVKTITGLHNYEVDNVSPDGKIVHMSGSGILVRVDVPTVSAFGFVDYPDYWWNTALNPDDYSLGRAYPATQLVSPDQTRAVALYSLTVDPLTYQVYTGIGGALVINTDTLAPVRPPIRTTEEDPDTRTGVAWSPDSQRFFTVLAVASDTEYPPHDPYVSEIGDEYVGAFSRDGVLLGSVLLQTRYANPGFFARTYSPICSPDGTRLYVYADSGSPSAYRVYTLDVTANTPTIIGSTLIPHAVRTGAVYPPGVSHDGKYLVRTSTNVDGSGTDGVVVITVRADDGDDVFDQVETFANSPAYDALNGTYDCVQGPQSRAGQPPDKRWFGLTSTKHLQAFKRFDADAVYDFDLTEYAVKTRFSLAAVGTRPKRKAA